MSTTWQQDQHPRRNDGKFRATEGLAPSATATASIKAQAGASLADPEVTLPEVDEATPEVSAPATTPTPTPTPAPPRAARMAEEKPWVRYNTDGSPNTGSYAFQASVGCVELAHESLHEHHGKPPPMSQVRYLARTLLRTSDAAQASIRSDGLSDRMDNSHIRARGAVRTALAAHPVPVGADDATREQWERDLTARSTEILQVAYHLFDED